MDRHSVWGKTHVSRPFLTVLLSLALFLGCGKQGGPPGPPETWDGPRNGAVGAPGWPSDRDGRVKVAVEPPSPWTAGSWIRCCLAFRPEGQPIVPGGGVRAGLRRGSDASLLQTSDPGGEGYVTAHAEGPSGRQFRTEVEIIEKENKAAPWTRAVQVILPDGLPTGGEVLVVLGNQSSGGLGFRVQTFSEDTPIFRAYSDGDGDGVYGPVPESLPIRVVGGDAVRFFLTAPAVVRAGREFDIRVRAEDPYWNTVTHYAGSAEVVVNQLSGAEFWEKDPSPGMHPVSESAVKAVRKIRTEAWSEGKAVLGAVCVDAAGLYELRVEGDLESPSLPLLVVGETPPQWLYWGDLHGHSELSDGAGTIDGYYEFARYEACLDFVAPTDHDWLLSDVEWELIVEAAERAYEPERFVTFSAYEWSEKWRLGGDHNVYYVSGKPELFRCSRSAKADTPEGENFLRALRGRDVLVIPHVGGRRGRWEVDSPELKVACEIVSVHGRNENYGLEGLRLGRYVGFIGSSDGHVGHPGRSHPAPPTFAVEPGGLAAIWATDLTREEVARAIRSRRTYATTGERIFVDFRVEGSVMGSRVERKGPVEIVARVAGTSPIRLIEILKKEGVVFRGEPESMACTVLWTDEDPRTSETYYYLRVRQADGAVAWSSPVWVRSKGF
ncbi:MAG: DUF3604 domain-containing protein [Candidatus Eisenbacteria sp.]|nr:DUF3604 domain-containing protein [Candidatus Eisenbacteria bacterium]